jgi:hypothetical protein
LTQSFSSTQSHDGNPYKADASNDHLVSGSAHDFYISENELTHKAWHAQEDNEDHSSEDEDEPDSVFSCDSENGGDDNGSGTDSYWWLL